MKIDINMNKTDNCSAQCSLYIDTLFLHIASLFLLNGL